MTTSFQSYQIPFKRPLLLKGEAFNDRRGFLVYLKNEKDDFGYGEIAPLPHFSEESYQQVAQNLENREFSSINFGFFQATAELKSIENKLSLPQYLHQLGDFKQPLPSQICLNGLIDAQEESDFKREVERILQMGYTTVKLKVGRASIEKDVQRIAWLKEIAENQLKVRLDANQAWTLKDALKFAATFTDIDILEYIEEPCQQFFEMESFAKITQIPVAVDESLYQQKPADALAFAPFASAFIIKPMLLKDFWQHFKSLILAKQKVIISSSFESGIGMRLLIALAAISQQSAGLDTYSWLEKDLLKSPIQIENGKISLAQVFNVPVALDEQYLDRK